jgi:nitric-oxide synthase
MDNGKSLGDPLHIDLTRAIMQLGWKKETRTAFDLLPLVIQMPDQPPALFELPRDIVLEVPILHPHYPCFAELGLKWHALPAISNMCLSIGGISFTAAPFNGWYMSTEIGSRNLGDTNRYNLLPLIAQKLELDTSSNRTLWKDRAMVELNIAVLDSFARCGISIVDHHTATQQFIQHEQIEKQAGNPFYANWSWIVPPLSGSSTPVFHRRYTNKTITPNFFYQPDPWHTGLLE